MTAVICTLIALLLIGSYFLFRDTMNKLQYIGRLYWITRDNAGEGDPRFAQAFMLGTSPPWKIGRGVQVRFFRWSFQVGLCHDAPLTDPSDEIAGLEYILSLSPSDVHVQA